MSPEDPNNPGLNTKNPDLSSVPLPEPAPIKSPYAPVGGTLGEVAQGVENHDATAPAPVSTPVETLGDVGQDGPKPVAPTTPETTGDPQSAITPDATVTPVVPPQKKKKLLPLIIVAVILVAAAIVCILLFVGKGNEDKKDSIVGSDTSFFKTNNFVIDSSESGSKKFAIYSPEGKPVTGFDYEYLSESIINNSLLAIKDGKYLIIDSEGKEIVKAGEYDTIVELGGLYGAKNSEGNFLLTGKGEKVLQYNNEFDKYSDYEGESRSAYTIFRNGKHFVIYNPFGEQVTEFDSEIVPTITSGHLEEGDASVVVYSDGVIVFNDKGMETRRIKKHITEQMYAIFVSKTSNVIGLSSVNEELQEVLGSVSAPRDSRKNSLIIKDKFYEYDQRECDGLYYDDTYVENDEDGYVLCIKGIDNYPILPNGDLSEYQYYSSSRTAGTSGTMLPLGLESYGAPVKAEGYEHRFEIVYHNKRVQNFVANKTTDYNFMGMFDNYIVQKIKKENGTQSGEVTFYNKKGEKICTFNKTGYESTTATPGMIMKNMYSVKTLSNSDVKGFVNGVALVRKVGAPYGEYVRINNKCEVEDEKTVYVDLSEYDGYTFLISKEANGKYKQRLLNKEGKEIASNIVDKSYSDKPSRLAGGYILFKNGSKTQLLINGNVAHEFEHFCLMNVSLRWTSKYSIYDAAGASQFCADKEAVAGEHYYFLPDGKQFYYWKEKGLKD